MHAPPGRHWKGLSTVDTHKAAPESRFRPGLAAGLSSFASVLLIVVGAFQALEGLSAIIKNDLLVVTPNYLYKFNVAGWGWIHLMVGLALEAVGAALLSGGDLGADRRDRHRGSLRNRAVS